MNDFSQFSVEDFHMITSTDVTLEIVINIVQVRHS